MDIWLIAGIVGFGLLLIMIEVFLIPGTTFVGIVGFLVVVGGVITAYTEHGPVVGNITFVVSAIASGALGYAGYRAYRSNKFSLVDVLEGRVNELEDTEIQAGDQGMTISYLRPNGKAEFGDKKIEVYSLGEFIKDNQPVEVVKIAGNKIFVKPLNLSE